MCVVEIGLSDFYRTTVSVMKMAFRKLSPKIIRYGDYIIFDNSQYMD